MSGWTTNKVEALRASWDAGDSAAIIGQALGFTRNAILGKVWRLGLSERRTVREAVSTRPDRVRGGVFIRSEFHRPSVRKEPAPKVESASYSIKTTRIIARKPPAALPQTKNDLRRMLQAAVLNTGGTLA